MPGFSSRWPSSSSASTVYVLQHLLPNAYLAHNLRNQRSDSCFSASTLASPTARVYLAQASLADLPQQLRQDLPTPDLVLKAGKGDVYDTSIWLGQAPTYTPLHRDPNPNLFVQLAGTKIVRLMKPAAGNAVFARVQEKIGGSGNAAMRGAEMMLGEEKRVLDEEVWGDGREGKELWEAEIDKTNRTMTLHILAYPDSATTITLLPFPLFLFTAVSTNRQSATNALLSTLLETSTSTPRPSLCFSKLSLILIPS